MAAIKQPINMKYWKSKNTPLLLQGFDIQFTSFPAPFSVLEDKEEFTTKVNRGIVNALDYVAISNLQSVDGLNEEDFDASQITLLAGGQEILVDEPGERYNYAIDVGEKDEQKIPVIINGGQQLTSRIFLPDATSNSDPAVSLFSCQLQAYYSTELHEAWKKQYAKFGRGLGLKRRSYRLRTPAATAPGFTELVDVIPKNVGKIIGVSFMFEGFAIVPTFVDFFVDDLGIIENVSTMRFSRFNQRDPFIFWVDLNPGSTFRLKQTNTVGAGTPSVSNLWVTFYFDN